MDSASIHLTSAWKIRDTSLNKSQQKRLRHEKNRISQIMGSAWVTDAPHEDAPPHRDSHEGETTLVKGVHQNHAHCEHTGQSQDTRERRGEVRRDDMGF